MPARRNRVAQPAQRARNKAVLSPGRKHIGGRHDHFHQYAPRDCPARRRLRRSHDDFHARSGVALPTVTPELLPCAVSVGRVSWRAGFPGSAVFKRGAPSQCARPGSYNIQGLGSRASHEHWPTRSSRGFPPPLDKPERRPYRLPKKGLRPLGIFGNAQVERVLGRWLFCSSTRFPRISGP